MTRRDGRVCVARDVRGAALLIKRYGATGGARVMGVRSMAAKASCLGAMEARGVASAIAGQVARRSFATLSRTSPRPSALLGRVWRRIRCRGRGLAGRRGVDPAASGGCPSVAQALPRSLVAGTLRGVTRL